MHVIKYVTDIELEELRRLEEMERRRIREQAKKYASADQERYIRDSANLFTKGNDIDINKEASDVNYFRGENLLEKINNKEVLFNLAISEREEPAKKPPRSAAKKTERPEEQEGKEGTNVGQEFDININITNEVKNGERESEDRIKEEEEENDVYGDLSQMDKTVYSRMAKSPQKQEFKDLIAKRDKVLLDKQ